MTALSVAEQLLSSFGVDHPAQIDVEAIAWACGAEVRYADLDSCEARIIGFGDRAIITVRNSSGWPRKRFSVGHELGHWRWHRGRSFVCRSDDIGSQSRDPLHPERVADQYAADLLMPGYLLKPLVGRMKRPCFEEIDALSQQFHTSRTAMAIQVIKLDAAPALLICHNAAGRRWFVASPSVPRRWFPKSELDADSCAMDVVFGTAENTRMQVTGADAWFDRYDADRHEVFEQARRGVNGEALCLVVLKSAEMMD